MEWQTIHGATTEATAAGEGGGGGGGNPGGTPPTGGGGEAAPPLAPLAIQVRPVRAALELALPSAPMATLAWAPLVQPGRLARAVESFTIEAPVPALADSRRAEPLLTPDPGRWERLLRTPKYDTRSAGTLVGAFKWCLRMRRQ